MGRPQKSIEEEDSRMALLNRLYWEQVSRVRVNR